MKNSKFILLALLICCCFACRKDSNINTTDLIIPEPTIIVKSSVDGYVVDLNDNPIADVLVYSDTKEATTDENGYFAIRDIETNKFHTLIHAEKFGYFDATDVISVENSDIARTKIILTPKSQPAKVTATNRIVRNEDLIQIDFTNTQFVNEDGSDHTGDVNVYSTYIDPSLNNIDDLMPGNLSAITSQNEITGLQSFGMIGVVIEDENGQELQPKTAVEIEIAVPTSLLNQAPSTIPLWHFNESTGYWVEEGEATLIGNKYVGLVDHFSFWNCDVPENFIYLEGKVVYNNMPVSGIKVQLTRKSNGDQRSTYTSADGHFGGKIPTNEKYLLEIFDDCGERVHWEDNIGPYTTDRNKGDIRINPTNILYPFSGVLVDCDNNPVTNGYVSALSDGSFSTFGTNENGEFFGIVSSCSNSVFAVRGYDLKESLKSDIRNIDVSINTDLRIKACSDEIIDGITFNFLGEVINYPNCTVMVNYQIAPIGEVLDLIFDYSLSANDNNFNAVYYHYTESPGDDPLLGSELEVTEVIGSDLGHVITFDITELEFSPNVALGEYWTFSVSASIFDRETNETIQTVVDVKALRTY